MKITKIPPTVVPKPVLVVEFPEEDQREISRNYAGGSAPTSALLKDVVFAIKANLS